MPRIKAKTPPDLSRRSGRRFRGKGKKRCCCCGGEFDFCWSCLCGLLMCQDCMDENAWGVTCNGVTWTCPDCGRTRSY